MRTNPIWALSISVLIIVGNAGFSRSAENSRSSESGAWFAKAKLGICFDIRTREAQKTVNQLTAVSYAPRASETARRESASAQAQKWVGAAKEIGAKYVLVAVNDIPSAARRNGSDHASHDSRVEADILRAVADECRKENLHFGIRYFASDSTIGEDIAYYFDPALPSNRTTDAAQIKEVRREIETLCKSYGKLDAFFVEFRNMQMSRALYAELPTLRAMIHSHQPDAITNDWPGLSGNIATLREIPTDAPTSTQDHPWQVVRDLGGGEESIRTNDSPAKWESGQDEQEVNLLRSILLTAGKGGNVLVRVVPQGMEPWSADAADALRDVGKWLKVNGDAIYGTEGSPFLSLPFEGTATVKENVLYAIVFDRPKDDVLRLEGLRSVAKRAKILGQKELFIQNVGQDVTIPDFSGIVSKRSPVAVAIQLVGNCDVDTRPIRANAQADLIFVSRAAAIVGQHAKFASLEEAGGRNLIAAKDLTGQGVDWKFELERPTRFEVIVDYSNPNAGDNSAITFAVDGKSLTAKLLATRTEREFRSQRIGEIVLEAGPGHATLHLAQNAISPALKVNSVRLLRKEGVSATPNFLTLSK